MIKLQPLSNRVVIKPDDQEEMSKGGIHIPSTTKYTPQMGTIIAVGPGFMAEVPYFIPGASKDVTKPQFARMPMNVSIGDRVFFAKNSGVHIQIDRDEFLVVRLTDLLAFVEEVEDE